MQNEMTITELKAMYFNADALTLPPVPLYRYQHRGDRFYYYIDPTQALDPQDKPPVCFAVGVTTLTRKTIPQPEGLTRWQADMGYDAAIAYRDLRAAYGTLMHTCIATLLIKRVIDLDTMDEVVANYCKANHITDANVGSWADDMRQDLLAFAQFMREYNVQPLAIELSLVSKLHGFAGTLDLLCRMDIPTKSKWGETYKTGDRKGEPKETVQPVTTLALVDFKSGRTSNGGLHNAAQLRLCKMLLTENYPEWQGVEVKLFNWNPKDWRTAPAYTLTDQTYSFSKEAALHCVALYKELYGDAGDKQKLEIFGVIDLNDPEEEVRNYSSLPINTIVQRAINDGEYDPQQYDFADAYFDVNAE
jgi:hypothetical protein